MTRILFLTAIRCGQLVQGETKAVERYIIVPGCIILLVVIFGYALKESLCR